MTEISNSLKRVAVIGAGAAGLSAAKHLLSRGIEVTVYELGSKIGGLWAYENDNELSPAYLSLHLNSEILVTAYKDFPFAEGSPLYPDHFEVHRYLESYADRFELRPHIRFNAKVEELEPLERGRWRIRLASGASDEFDSVVVATGHQGVPSQPAWRDKFTGEYLHAHAYRVPEPFRGKRVLVVGMGNSAVDIAADICVVTATTHMSARSPVLMMPRMMFGVPTSRVLAQLEKPWMPWPVRRRIREFLTRIVHGRMEQWGFVTPKTRTHPTSHPSLISHCMWNRIKGKPGISDVSGHEVTFTDGTRETYDTVIAATGYQVDLPFLAKERIPMRGHQLDLFHRVVAPSLPGLFFIGFFNVSGGGNIRMMDTQAEWVAEIASGDIALPSEQHMKAAIEEEHRLLIRRYPGSPRYALELDPSEYNRALILERRQGRKRVASRSVGTLERAGMAGWRASSTTKERSSNPI